MRVLPRPGPLSLRTTITLSFASLALIVSAILAGGTYLAARGFLIGQREQTAAQQAFASASVVRDGLPRPHHGHPDSSRLQGNARIGLRTRAVSALL